MTTHETADAPTYLPTDEDVAFYREHGWWVSPQVLPDEYFETALLGAERHYSGERDHSLLIAGGYLDWRPEHGDGVRLNDYVSLQNDQLHAAVHEPAIARMAARLAGTDAIRLFHDQLVCKPPGLARTASRIGWHVDAAYWSTCTSRDMLTAWIPFQDCDPDMGTLCVMDGSHRWVDTGWMATFMDARMEELEERLAEGGAEIRKVPLHLKRGQISFHHCRTIHGSEDNEGRADRMALAIHLQDAANRYVEHLDENGRRTVHINDLLCRRDADGNPDYADPDVCPTLWAADAD
jgi:ectoine hydroxylase-related dioxygenase (phytanoyl-CoA dioxygenase family)